MKLYVRKARKNDCKVLQPLLLLLLLMMMMRRRRMKREREVTSGRQVRLSARPTPCGRLLVNVLPNRSRESTSYTAPSRCICPMCRNRDRRVLVIFRSACRTQPSPLAEYWSEFSFLSCKYNSVNVVVSLEYVCIYLSTVLAPLYRVA